MMLANRLKPVLLVAGASALAGHDTAGVDYPSPCFFTSVHSKGG